LRSSFAHIKIHQTSAAARLLDVLNQQSGSFFLACPSTATSELSLSAFRSPSTHIKIYQTSAADPLLNVSNQQTAHFLSPVPANWLLAKNSSSKAEAQRISVCSSQIKIHQTSAADPLLNVSNQQSGTFFCRLFLPIGF
jgi:hypothetical protein